MNRAIAIAVRVQQRGIITDREFANEVLTSLILDCAPQEVAGAINELPLELARKLSNRLSELRAINFQWFPTFVGPGLNKEEQHEFIVQLQSRFSVFEEYFATS